LFIVKAGSEVRFRLRKGTNFAVKPVLVLTTPHLNTSSQASLHSQEESKDPRDAITTKNWDMTKDPVSSCGKERI